MSVLAIVPVGTDDNEAVAVVAQVLGRILSTEVRILPRMAMPEGMYDAGRGQHEALHILRRILEHPDIRDGRVLAVTDADLFIPMLTFVYGQAQLGGRAAVMSLARLRQEYYGLPGNQSLFYSRAVKEAVHEVGHTFGLTHCHEPGCVMQLSNGIQQVDAKSGNLCADCGLLLRERMTDMMSKN